MWHPCLAAPRQGVLFNGAWLGVLRFVHLGLEKSVTCNCEVVFSALRLDQIIPFAHRPQWAGYMDFGWLWAQAKNLRFSGRMIKLWVYILCARMKGERERERLLICTYSMYILWGDFAHWLSDASTLKTCLHPLEKLQNGVRTLPCHVILRPHPFTADFCCSRWNSPALKNLGDPHRSLAPTKRLHSELIANQSTK